MIQRIQTIWLLIASALGFVSLKTSVYSGHLINDATKTFYSVNGTYNILLVISTTFVAAAALITVFLFKDRKLQIKISIVSFILSIITLFFYYLQLKNFVAAESNYNLTAIVPLFVPVFLFLAIRGIYKDLKLVQSADKLR